MKNLFVVLLLVFSFNAQAYEAVPEQGRGTDGHPTNQLAAVNVDQLDCNCSTDYDFESNTNPSATGTNSQGTQGTGD